MKTTFLERLCSILSPAWFFVGMALGMALCVSAGHWAAHRESYPERSRFFFKVSPEGYVYPTLENLCEYVRHKAPKDKILVLVAGSSIPLGCGQKNAALWTDRLQEQLGPEFAVVNVSFRSCYFSSIGMPLAEILSKEYPRWYLVSDLSFSGEPSWLFIPKGTYPYRYVLWQARVNGSLMPNAVRDAELKGALFSKDEEIRHCAQEDLLRALLEKETKASNLWNWIGNEYFFPAFSPLLPRHLSFCTPRKEVADDEFDIPPLVQRADSIRELEMSTLRRILHSSSHPEPAQRFSNFRLHPLYADRLGKMIPDMNFRRHMLFLVNARCPLFVNELDSEERERYIQSLWDNTHVVNLLGYNAVTMGIDYQTEDYVDLSHFSGLGAPKMARDASIALLDMVRRDSQPARTSSNVQ